MEKREKKEGNGERKERRRQMWGLGMNPQRLSSPLSALSRSFSCWCGAQQRTCDVGKEPPSLLRLNLQGTAREKVPLRTLKTRTASGDALQLSWLSLFTNEVESES